MRNHKVDSGQADPVWRVIHFEVRVILGASLLFHVNTLDMFHLPTKDKSGHLARVRNGED